LLVGGQKIHISENLFIFSHNSILQGYYYSFLRNTILYHKISLVIFIYIFRSFLLLKLGEIPELLVMSFLKSLKLPLLLSTLLV